MIPLVGNMTRRRLNPVYRPRGTVERFTGYIVV